MAKEDRAAVIAAEQRAVDHAYNCLERKMQETKRLSESPAGASAKDNAAQRREFQKRLASYEDLGGKSLVFARVDVEEGEEPETFYLGRRAVRDGDRNLVVIDWRTDTAIRWRKASQRNPGEVRLRRRLRCHAHQVVDFFDEVAAPERAHPADPEPGARPSPVTVEAAIANTRRQESDHESVDPFLLEELARVRDGHMRDIVETIQRAQLDLVSDDRPGVLIVQGGPGTGKTAIGLHRVSWLLGNERVNKGISADEILVVGPHQGFLDYVSQVLPILDSRGVATVQLRSLWREEPAGTDTDQQRLIKSDLRMVRVLHRAVANSVRPYALDRFTHHGLFETVFEGTRLAISREELGRLLTQARGSNGAFDAQRSRFAEALTDHLMREAVGLRPSRERDSRLRRRIKESTDVRSLLNAVWPKVSEDGILRRLLNDAEELHAAASGILTDEEQRVLLRPRVEEGTRDPWTIDDLVCLEELRRLISGTGPRRYRHILVDEAQDLTPMQVRSLGLRCRTGSMTVLGDLAQSTGVHRYREWSEVAEPLAGPDGWHMAELTTGYRVPREVMDFVAPLAATVSPTTRYPSSIRPPDDGSVRLVSTSPDRLLAEVKEGVKGLLEADEQPRSVAVILHDDDVLLPEAKEQCTMAESEAAGSASGVQVLPDSQINGLEFDHVVVVEPASIARTQSAGLGRLYVALTRCTQSLTIVHAEPLPAELADPSGPRTGEPSGERRCSRYRIDGHRCENMTAEPDGWCRQDECGGYRTGTPVDRPERRSGSAFSVPMNADRQARLTLADERVAEMKITATALNQFLTQHQGTAHEAGIEIRSMLEEFLRDGRHARQQNGFWVLDHEGFRLVLSPDADAVTGYRTVHLERSYAQCKAGVSSRVGRRGRAARRAALRERPAPGCSLVDANGVRGIDSQQIYITAQTHDTFERLVPESRGLSDTEFDAMVSRFLSADLENGRILTQESLPHVIGGELTWYLSPDGRTAISLRARAGTEPPEEPVDVSEDDNRAALAVTDAPATTDTEPILPTPQETSAAETDGLLTFLEAAVHGDRKVNAHEALRHTFLAALFDAGQSPIYSEIVDAASNGPAGTILYEVLGEGGHTYTRMREGVLRAMEVRHITRIRADHTFLVLPQPPAEPWATDAVSQTFGVSVIWRTDHGWEGQRVGLALGKEV